MVRNILLEEFKIQPVLNLPRHSPLRILLKTPTACIGRLGRPGRSRTLRREDSVTIDIQIELL